MPSHIRYLLLLVAVLALGGCGKVKSGPPQTGMVTVTAPAGDCWIGEFGPIVGKGCGSKTYRVTMDLEPAAQPAAPARRDQDPNKDSGVVPTRRRKLYFELLLVGAAAIGSYLIWREVTESPSLPK